MNKTQTSIHPSPPSYLGLGRGGSSLRTDAQASLSPATSSGSQGIPGRPKRQILASVSWICPEAALQIATLQTPPLTGEGLRVPGAMLGLSPWLGLPWQIGPG